MSVEDEVMKIQRKLSKITSADEGVSNYLLILIFDISNVRSANFNNRII